VLKEIKTIKVWTDDYEAVEKTVGDVEVLYEAM
jgi:peptide chain release factor 2